MTTEIPMNNQPTFEPNQYYYCVTDTRRVIIVKVEKLSQSKKSLWLKNYNNYCIIKSDEKGKYIKCNGKNFYAINNVYLFPKYLHETYFHINFIKICYRIEPQMRDPRHYFNFKVPSDNYYRINEKLINMKMYEIDIDKKQQICFNIKPSVKDYTFQILETVEEFKEKISDNEYKTVVELLQKIHNYKS